MKLEYGLAVCIHSITLPIAYDPIDNKSPVVVSIQYTRDERLSDPHVIARILPGRMETIQSTICFTGPCNLNIIVDCETPEANFAEINFIVTRSKEYKIQDTDSLEEEYEDE